MLYYGTFYFGILVVLIGNSLSVARSDTTTATASTSEEDSVDACAPSAPESIYVAMNNNNNNNNNNTKNNGIANGEGVEKYPLPTPKEVGGLDEIYAAPNFYSSDAKCSFDHTHSLLRFV